MNKYFDESSAIYLQIATMLEDDILRGVIRQDEQAPSQNELARAYQINPATAAKGLNILVEEGILYKKRGVGMFVAQEGQEKIIQKRKNAFYESYVKEMMREAQALGISMNELMAMLEQAAKK